ncbi:MAG: hypothetical protein II956_16115 [Bacteroidales bacterium]|nr:hypothetical protein [Bacteroidales bacterium]
MSFDYLSDIYGKYRVNKENRFSNVETKAVGLIKLFVDSAINNKEFMDSFLEVRDEFMKLLQSDGQMVIDQDTPLWLNKFLGFQFVDWFKVEHYKWQIEEQAAEHPEQVTDEIREIQNNIKNFEARFVEVCKNVLTALEKK